jgi:hypothetical protein
VVLDSFVPETEPEAQLSGTYWQQWSSGWGQRRLTVPRLVNITPLPSPAFPYFFHKLILLLIPPHDPPLQNLRSLRDHEGGDGVEGPTTGKAGVKGGRRRRKPPSEEVGEGEGASDQGFRRGTVLR